MGFEALTGGCEHCKSEYRQEGDFLKVLADPNVFKETEVIDIFTRASDNSIDGVHKELGFPHFVYRTRICRACLERYETTDELFDKLKANEILIMYLERGEQCKILTRPNDKVAQ